MQTMDIVCKGNMFLNKLFGSQIIVVPQLQYKSGLKQMMEKMSEKLWVKGQRTVKPRKLHGITMVAFIKSILPKLAFKTLILYWAVIKQQ